MPLAKLIRVSLSPTFAIVNRCGGVVGWPNCIGYKSRRIELLEFTLSCPFTKIQDQTIMKLRNIFVLCSTFLFVRRCFLPWSPEKQLQGYNA